MLACTVVPCGQQLQPEGQLTRLAPGPRSQSNDSHESAACLTSLPQSTCNLKLRICGVLQTAHDKAYLAKNLLAGLPPVTKRVAEMRAGRSPGPNNSQAQAEVDQSQEAYVKVRCCCSFFNRLNMCDLSFSLAWV